MPLSPVPIGKTGLAKPSGGSATFGIPDTQFGISTNTTTLTINEVRYVPFRSFYGRILTAVAVEVQAGPASNANLRIGLYAADFDNQPIGAPIYDSGNIAVASGFSGVKSLTGLAVPLPPGRYVSCVNCDVAMALRTYYGPTSFLSSGLGAGAFFARGSVAQTYGAFPNPGTVWTTATFGTNPLQNIVIWQWTE